MFTRTTGLLIVPLWLAAMGWLVAHDVLPAWTAQDPPKTRATAWIKGDGDQTQYSILHDNSQFGTIWTDHLVGEDSLQRFDTIWIERYALPIAPLLINVSSSFTAEGLLDELDIHIVNPSGQMKLHGERFHADFSFSFQSGTTEKTFKIPLSQSGMISEAFSPFATLCDLRVGQTWRMQVFNPIAALTGVGSKFIPMLAKVTGEETIATSEGERNCFVVESDYAKAWVDRRGVVHVQEMELPLTGTIRIVRLPGFDKRAQVRARNHVFRGTTQRQQP